MQYLVRALDARQQLQTLAVDAFDESDARDQATQRQLTALSVDRADRLTRRAAPFPLLLFAQELLALVSAGLSVIEALDTLLEKEVEDARRAVLSRLTDQLRQGLRLSGAMQQQPTVFPPLFVGIVQAAEGTSDLPQALARYVAYESRSQAVRHQVLSAAIYPAILLVVGGAVALFLLGYVVPRFSAVYQGSGRELPWASRALMEWGDFARHHTWGMLVALGVVVGTVSWSVRREVANSGWLRLLRPLPGARQHLQRLHLARLYLTLGMLLEGGIPLARSLALCSVVMEADSAAALANVNRRVQSGESLSTALETEGLATPVALRLLRVGEQSGQLGTMLQRTAAFYEAESSRWIERFSKAFEPVLMAAIGLVIGLIVILLYLPIFELAGSLQ